MKNDLFIPPAWMWSARFAPRILLLSLAALSAPACVSDPVPVGEPIEADLRITDAEQATQIRSLIAAARQEPRDARRRAQLGIAYEVVDLFDAALGSYQQAVALDPSEPRYSYYGALIRGTRLGDLEGALRDLDSVLAIEEGYVPAYLHRGQWLLDLDRLDDAFAAFTRATELEPRNATGWLGLARVHMKQESPRKSIDILERLPREQWSPYVYQMAGLAYRQSGDLERATELLGMSRPGPPPGWQDPWHLEKAAFVTGFAARAISAKELIGLGRFDDAIRVLVALCEERPGDPDVVSDLGIAYLASSRIDEAMNVLLEGVEQHPDHYPLHYSLSRCYATRQDLDAAMRHVDRVIEIHPAYAPAHETRGVYLLHMNRQNEAHAAFTDALAYDAERKSSLLQLAFIEANVRQDWDRAIDFARRAIAVDPSMARAHLMLGWALAERGDITDGAQAVARAAELEPGSPQLQFVRSRLQQLRSAAP